MPKCSITTITAAANCLKANLTGQDREDLDVLLAYARNKHTAAKDLRKALADNNAYVLLQMCHCSAGLGHKCERCKLIAANAKVME